MQTNYNEESDIKVGYLIKTLFSHHDYRRGEYSENITVLLPFYCKNQKSHATALIIISFLNRQNVENKCSSLKLCYVGFIENKHLLFYL